MTDFRREYPVCHMCGYDLRGIGTEQDTKCPECGRYINWQLAWRCEPDPRKGWSKLALIGFLLSPSPGVLSIAAGRNELTWWLGWTTCFIVTWGLITARMMRAKAPIAIVIALLPSIVVSFLYCQIVLEKLEWLWFGMK